MRFTLFEDLGDEKGRFEVVDGFARSRPPGPLSLAAADGGSGQAQLMQEEAIGPPVRAGGFEDIDWRGVELISQTISLLGQPQSRREVSIGDATVTEDLLTVGQWVNKGSIADLLVRVDATGQVETVFEGFSPHIVVAEGVIVVFETRVEQTSECHGHGYSPPFQSEMVRSAKPGLPKQGMHVTLLLSKGRDVPADRFPIKGRYPGVQTRPQNPVRRYLRSDRCLKRWRASGTSISEKKRKDEYNGPMASTSLLG